MCIVTRPTAEALARVQAAVRAQGYTLSHRYNARVRGKQRANRLKLRRAMLAQGFKGLETEW